jgi:hypothetical protein
MGFLLETDRVNLRQVFFRVQERMRAELACSDVMDHPGASGAATEQRWIDLFNRYLPQRYRATSAFVIDADGWRSRQIDIAIYDHFYSPLLFHDETQPSIPAESVYAVFEVKQTLTAEWIKDAASKAASVRRLRRTSAPLLSAGSVHPPKEPHRILAGVLSRGSVWQDKFKSRATFYLQRLRGDERLDLGCSLGDLAFEATGAGDTLEFSEREEALIYFMLRLIIRLQQMGAAPAIDLAEYGRCLK